VVCGSARIAMRTVDDATVNGEWLQGENFQFLLKVLIGWEVGGISDEWEKDRASFWTQTTWPA